MSRICLLLFSIQFLNSCHSQSIDSSKNQNGIVYFSFDNGLNWVNSSNGLPQKVQIGLGGIATSNKFLGLATKEKGVYIYNFKAKLWKNVPTDKQILEANISALAIVDSTIFVGTQSKGIFYTNDNGKNWTNINTGLTNTTIRRFWEYNRTLYVCTNDGFYSFNNNTKNWQLEFGQKSLQTNGATIFNGNFYLATNRGIFSQQKDKVWVNSSPQFSMHNISADKNRIYAMTYNELLLSSADGTTWQKQQSGFPKELYTFNVLNHNNVVLAGQWDGIYKANNMNSTWELYSKGLPPNFAVTNLKSFNNNILVISTSERKLKNGLTTQK